MKILDFLQGKWLGHPVHPALVHLPVGLWTVACAVDIAVRAGIHVPGGGELALYCVGLGLLAAVGSVPTGLADWWSIKKGKPAWKLGLIHMGLNLAATAAWAVNFAQRLWLGQGEPIGPAVLGTSIAGTVLLFAGAYVGTLLVFDQGASVARLSKKKWREIAIQGDARVPEEKS